MTIEVRRATIAPHTHHEVGSDSQFSQGKKSPKLALRPERSIADLKLDQLSIRYGVTANIAAFHAAARGSIPRIGVPFCSFVPRKRGHRSELATGKIYNGIGTIMQKSISTTQSNLYRASPIARCPSCETISSTCLRVSSSSPSAPYPSSPIDSA